MRMTPQTRALLEEIEIRRHASNNDLLEALKQRFPGISATTVHRITKRLVEEKRLLPLRSPLEGTLLFDARAEPHYHFACQPCGKVYDIELPLEFIKQVEASIGAPLVDGVLTVTGIKADCPHYKK